MANITIGHIKCLITGQQGEVRRSATGKRLFYYYSEAGMITPNLSQGQKWILSNATWLENGEPLDIGELNRRYGIEGKSEAVTDENPVYEPKPKKKGILESFWSDDDE